MPEDEEDFEIDLSDPGVCYRIGLLLKSAAMAFLETVPPDVDPIVYGPGFELRLKRLDPGVTATAKGNA